MVKIKYLSLSLNKNFLLWMRISGFINLIDYVPGTSKKLTDLPKIGATYVPCELWYGYELDRFLLQIQSIINKILN